MKPAKFFIVLTGLFATVTVMTWQIGLTHADSISARDLSADAALIEQGGPAGALPPTGSNALPGALPAGTGSANLLVGPNTRAGAAGGLDPATLEDGKARVFDVKGEVKYSKENVHGWQALKEDADMEPGHAVLTSKQSSVSITFDNAYQNVVHIPENTRAVIKSIEPTDIELQDGTLFNIFDALPKGSGWQTSTPQLVASVRGTHYVMSKSLSECIAAVFAEGSGNNSISAIKLQEMINGAATGSWGQVPEGYQLKIPACKDVDADMLQQIDQKLLEQYQELIGFINSFRGLLGGVLPPTAGEFNEPDTVDPDPDSPGGGPDPLDQEDTGVVLPTQTLSDSDSDSDSDSFMEEGMTDEMGEEIDMPSPPNEEQGGEEFLEGDNDNDTDLDLDLDIDDDCDANCEEGQEPSPGGVAFFAADK